MKKHFKAAILSGYVVIILAMACKIPGKTTRLQDNSSTPAVYTVAPDDTSNMALQPASLFFKDTILVRLIEAALEGNLQLADAKQRVRMAEAVFTMNRALRQPTLQAGLQGQVDRFGFYTMNGIGNLDLNKSENITPDQRIPNPVPEVMLGLRSQWEIDVWGRLRLLGEAAGQRLETERAMQRWMTTQIVAEVARQYYTLIALKIEKEVVERNIVLQQDALDIVKALKEGGRATELAVQQFSAQLYRTSTLRYSLQQQVVVAENAIRLLCGEFPATVPADTNSLLLETPESLAVGVPSALLINRPDVQAHLYALEAAYLEKEAARAAFLPSFNIAAYVGWQGFKMPAFFDFRSIAFGLLSNISAPLLQRRQVRGQYVLSDAALQSSLLQYQHTLRMAVGEVYNMIKANENLGLEIDFRKKELDTWRAAVSTANNLYISGYATYLEIITAQQNLLDADLELIRLKERQWHAVIALYRATGGGWRVGR